MRYWEEEASTVFENHSKKSHFYKITFVSKVLKCTKKIFKNERFLVILKHCEQQQQLIYLKMNNTTKARRVEYIITDVFWLKMSAKETTHYLRVTYWPHDCFIFYLSINQAPNFQNSCHSTSFSKEVPYLFCSQLWISMICFTLWIHYLVKLLINLKCGGRKESSLGVKCTPVKWVCARS